MPTQLVPLLKLLSRHYDLGDDSSQSSFVQFTIHSASRHKKILLLAAQDGGVIVDQTELPLPEPVAPSCPPPLTFETSYPIVSNMLSELPIDASHLDGCTREIISEASKIVNTEDGPRHEMWVVSVEIQIVTALYLGESMDEATTRSSNLGMIPATEASIEALKKVGMVDIDSSGKCSEKSCCPICLEEFSVGSHVTSMPCSHVFHPNCIIRWLNNSHYCPMCRFEMPA